MLAKGAPIERSILLNNRRHCFSQIAGAKIASQVENVVVLEDVAIVLCIKVVPLLGIPMIKRSLLQGWSLYFGKKRSSKIKLIRWTICSAKKGGNNIVRKKSRLRLNGFCLLLLNLSAFK